jgi:transcriptional regulator with XRE-family HTH domain
LEGVKKKKQKKPLDPATKATLHRLGRRLLQRREALGRTQADIAFACGMDQQGYQQIETAHVNITLKTLTKLAAALEVDIAALLAPLASDIT